MAQEIRRKFKRIFIVRAVLLAVLALLSVLFSTLTLEQFLIKSALRSEADYFWQKNTNHKNVSAPDTWNLKGFLLVTDKEDVSIVPKTPGESAQEEAILKGLFTEKELEHMEQSSPSFLTSIATGFTRLNSQPGYSLLYKTERNDQQLLLFFDGENVRSLAIFLGIIPLILFLLISYLLVWLFYRKAKEMLSPITWLASKFADFNPVSANMPSINLSEMPSDADYEATILAESLSEYVQRIEKFIGRERAFTRDVSHELRTPLTVIQMATEMMEVENQLSEKDRKTLSRIKGASKDMLELVEVFLILARESDNQIEESDVDIHDVIEHELAQSESLIQGKPVNVVIKQYAELNVVSSAKILEVLLGNLIRNAFKYTNEGSVTIAITQSSVSIIDTGIGMSEAQLEQVFDPYFRAGTRPDGGHGVGLTIVKRISDRFNWSISIDSELGKGSTVTVNFMTPSKANE